MGSGGSRGSPLPRFQHSRGFRGSGVLGGSGGYGVVGFWGGSGVLGSFRLMKNATPIAF